MSLKKTIFHALAEKHQDEIYEYAHYLLSNSSDAQDVTQEVLLRLWEHAGTFKLLAARSWLKRVARNRCIDLIRKRESTTNKDLPLEFTEEEALRERSVTQPFRQTEASEIGLSISQAIERLPENQRSVFVLHQIQGHNHRQIGSILGIPISTSKVTLMRARQQLQVLLEPLRPHHEK